MATIVNPFLNGVNPLFNDSNPVFDAPKRTSQAEFTVLMSTRGKYSTVISNKTLEEYGRLMEAIRNISVMHMKMELKWLDLCREKCHSNDDHVIPLLLNSSLLLRYPEAVMLHLIPSERKEHLNINRLFIANLLGDVELDSDGLIARAKTLMINIKLKENLSAQTYARFEEALVKLVNNFPKSVPTSSEEQSTDLSLIFWSVRSYVREVVSTLQAVHYHLLFSISILTLVSIICNLHNNSYQSRPFVGLHMGAVLSLSCLCCYCIHVSGSGQLNTLVFPAVFIVAAVGILLLSSVGQCWKRYSMAALHPVEKLAFIYSWDVPCFALGILVLVISSVGTALFTQNLLIQQSLLAIGGGLAAIFVGGLMYMTVWWYVSTRREACGLKWFQWCQKGDESFNEKYVLDYDEITSIKMHEKLADLKPCVSRFIGRILANYNLRTITVAIFIIGLIFSFIGGVLERKVEMREELFVDEDSNSAKFLEKYQTAFEKYEDYLEITIDAPFDYYDKRRKEQLFELFNWAAEQQYTTKIVSWLVDFERFQKSTIYDVNLDTMVPVINYVFLKTKPYRKYSTDLVFDKFLTQVLKSRMYMELSTKGIASSGSFIEQLIQRGKAANIPLSVKAPYSFSLHHDLQAFYIASWALAYFIVIATLGCFILFTNPATCMCVSLGCATVSLGVIGSAHYLNVPVNVVTLATVLIGNILTSAVTLHFCYMFTNCGPSQTLNTHRIEYAFQCTLRPTVLTYSSLILLSSPLLLNTAPAILHIWKMFLFTAAVGLFHYLFVLPTVLIITSGNLSRLCWSVSQMCDENGGCCTVEQPTKSIYFVPGRGNRHHMIGAPSYMSSNYIMNTAALPPAYDRRMLMAPPLPPPPPQIEYSSSAGGSVKIPAQSPSRRRSHGINNSDKYHIHETTESNCNSLDSRGPVQSNKAGVDPSNVNRSSSVPSCRHLTPNRERRYATNGHSRSQENSDKANGEQIYEEPESPITIHPRRSANPKEPSTFSPHSPSQRQFYNRSGDFFTGDNGNNKRRPLFATPSSAGIDPAMYPNWRQYLIEGSISQDGTPPVNRQVSNTYRTNAISSPTIERRRYRF